MSHFTKAAFAIAAGGVTVAGTATIIPLTPILILAGIIGGTLVLINRDNNSTGLSLANANNSKPNSTPPQIAKLQTTAGDGKFYIQSQSGDFCSAELDGDCRLTCNRKIVQEWEHFEMLRASDGRFAFQASNKRYVSADSNKGGLLIANRDQIADWELFTIEERDDSFVAFKASNGKYVSRRQNDHTLLKATATSVKEWELFSVTMMKDQKTSLK